MASVPFMKVPEEEILYEVGNYAEVFCDHDDKNGERVRGWLKGVIVQVDTKMVAVQFQTSVYLTDGWMVPDHILWYPVNSANIRPFGRRKSRS